MERPRSATAAPTPKSAQAGAKGGGAKGGAYQFAASQGLRVGKGVGHAASGMTSGGGGTIALLALTFLVVAMAKYQGADIQISKALFGGFILAVVLSALSKVNNRLALMFALLVFIAAMLEYGSNIASIFSNVQSIPTPVAGYGSTPSTAAQQQAALGVSSNPLTNAITGQTPTVANTSPTLGNAATGVLQTLSGVSSDNPIKAVTGAVRTDLTTLRGFLGSLF